MRVTLRPTIAADLVHLLDGAPLPNRIQAITALADDRVVGIGGFVFIGSDVWASVLMLEEARRYRAAIHRAGLMAMALARRQRFPAVYAFAEEGLAGAEAWLERLGFVPFDVAGRKAFVWRRG